MLGRCGCPVEAAGVDSCNPQDMPAVPTMRVLKGVPRDCIGKAHGQCTKIWYILVRLVWPSMKRNTSVELSDEISEFVAREVKSGRYGSASEVIRAGLRLLQDQETRMAALRAALIEGEQSGAPVSFDIDRFIESRKAARHG